jgi:excisionase family DNA binding protein
MSDYLSVTDSAERLGISERRVRALIESGRLPAERVGSRYLVHRRDLARPRVAGRPGRPMSAQNAWAMLAILSGADPDWVSPSSRWRTERLIADAPDRAVDALASSAPRSVVHRWRLLPSDLPKLEREFRLVATGLAARESSLRLPTAESLDAYVAAHHLDGILRRFRPAEQSRDANVVLRVPVNDWILRQRDTAPPAVVASDLLDHPDARVAREARRLARSVVHAHRNP